MSKLVKTNDAHKRSKKFTYKSGGNKNKELANYYFQTHNAPHRYLAYRDIPAFIHQFVKGKQALDFGAGTGASTEFLHNLGFDVIGVDVNFNMLEKARTNLPNIKFYHVDELEPQGDLDFIFSSFILLELSSKQEIIQYLNKSYAFLKEDGIFIGITSSEQLYSLARNWMLFNVNFEENRDIHSGDMTRLLLKHPEMEFYDYYWTEADYLDCFEQTNFKILQIHFPLGFSDEPYSWGDEIIFSPFTVFIAKK